MARRAPWSDPEVVEVEVVCAHSVRTDLVDILVARVDLVVVVLVVVANAVLLICPMVIGTVENACQMAHAGAEVEAAVVAGLHIRDRLSATDCEFESKSRICHEGDEYPC
jgi:hypothetical protein